MILKQTQATGLAAELGKRDPFDSPAQEVFVGILRTCSVLCEPFDRLFKQHGLSAALYNVLRIVAGHGEQGVMPNRIADHLVSRGPDVTRLIKRLEAMDLVYRCDCPRDARCCYICLTQTGRAKLAVLNPLVRRLHEQQLGGVESAAMRQVSDLLSLVRRSAAMNRTRLAVV